VNLEFGVNSACGWGTPENGDSREYCGILCKVPLAEIGRRKSPELENETIGWAKFRGLCTLQRIRDANIKHIKRTGPLTTVRRSEKNNTQCQLILVMRLATGGSPSTCTGLTSSYYTNDDWVPLSFAENHN
jgi:hypothetical protein